MSRTPISDPQREEHEQNNNWNSPSTHRNIPLCLYLAHYLVAHYLANTCEPIHTIMLLDHIHGFTGLDGFQKNMAP